MIEVTFKSGAIVTTDAPEHVFSSNPDVVSIKPSGYCGKLSYDYLDPFYRKKK